MTLPTADQRQPSADAPGPSRRWGYLVGALINAALLWLVNVQPGWSSFGFLTQEASGVLVLVNLSMAAGLIVNLVYLRHDSARVTALGGLVTTTTGLLAAARLLEVFPFDLESPYSTVVRVLLVVAVIGSAIGILANLAALLVPGRRRSHRAPSGRDGALRRRAR